MYTSPSLLPRRAPLRLPFSVHIRKLFFLFSQLRSLHHPPLIPHLSHRRSGHASRRGWGLSLCLPCRGPVLAPRRGRRPRRPAHVSSMSPTGRVSRSGATSFCPRRQKDAKTPPKTHGLWNFFRPLAITAQKGPTTNRLYFYPRCRSHVPQCSAASYRRGTMLRPLLYTAMYHDLKFSAVQRAAHTLAAGGGKCAI